MKKGATTTEYVIILVVILLIVIMSSTLLNFFPSFLQAEKAHGSEAYWSAAQPFSITETKNTGGGSLLLVLQNDADMQRKLSAVKVTSGSNSYTSILFGQAVFKPGARRSISVTIPETGSAGWTYDDVCFVFDAGDATNLVQCGKKSLTGAAGTQSLAIQGAGCATNGDCISGTCQGHVCVVESGACNNDAECASGNCGANGFCTEVAAGVCNPQCKVGFTSSVCAETISGCTDWQLQHPACSVVSDCNGFYSNCDLSCSDSCKGDGNACTLPNECCGNCVNGVCDSGLDNPCKGTGESCVTDSCCSGLTCNSITDTCVATSCKAVDESCTSAAQCCSGTCTASKCAYPFTCSRTETGVSLNVAGGKQYYFSIFNPSPEYQAISGWPPLCRTFTLTNSGAITQMSLPMVRFDDEGYVVVNGYVVHHRPSSWWSPLIEYPNVDLTPYVNKRAGATNTIMLYAGDVYQVEYGGAAWINVGSNAACTATGSAATYPQECCTGTISGGVCACKAATGYCQDNDPGGTGSLCCSSFCAYGKKCGSSAPSCKNRAESCTTGGDCCSGSCSSGVCLCASKGATCSVNGDCCTGTCTSGKCDSNPSCPISCMNDAECSTNCGSTPNCVSGTCSATSCTARGGSCTKDSNCCTNFCKSGSMCFCVQNGNNCVNNNDCCSGTCSKGTCSGTISCPGMACAVDAECLSMCGSSYQYCNQGTCQATTTSCTSRGTTCSKASDCCTNTCTSTKCICVGSGSTCDANSDCCSNLCDSSSAPNKCKSVQINNCVDLQSIKCTSDTECSTYCSSQGLTLCTSGTCTAPVCKERATACTVNSDCCSNTCYKSTCVCGADKATCTKNADCCSGNCNAGQCKNGATCPLSGCTSGNECQNACPSTPTCDKGNCK